MFLNLGEMLGAVRATRRMLACLAQCEQDTQTQRLELRASAGLLTSWTLSQAEADLVVERVQVRPRRVKTVRRKGALPAAGTPNEVRTPQGIG